LPFLSLADMARRSKKMSYRSLAALKMAQLYRLAKVHIEAGDILDAEPWLKVASNILSSAPSGAEGSRRGTAPPIIFGLSVDSLALAAVRLGLNFTAEQIERHVMSTANWRAHETILVGRPVYRPMKPDTIGRLLGITQESRKEARAWLIGTFDGSPQARKEAYAAREAQRRRQDRTKAGARSHSQSISRQKPWKDVGISRATWYRQRAVVIDANVINGNQAGITSPPATSNKKSYNRKSSPGNPSGADNKFLHELNQEYVSQQAANSGNETISSASNKQLICETVSSATVSSATNKISETISSATNNNYRHSDGSGYALPSNSQVTDIQADIQISEFSAKLSQLRQDPAAKLRLKDAIPGGMVVRAVRAIKRQ
jgi:hypothetical protein